MILVALPDLSLDRIVLEHTGYLLVQVQFATMTR
jgi:hypothetical protein